MNKEATQINKPCNQQQPRRRVRTGSEPGPVGGMGRCDQLKRLSKLVFEGKLNPLTWVVTIVIVAIVMVTHLSNNMTVGRVNFSLKLMQLVDMQLEVEKPAEDDPHQP